MRKEGRLLLTVVATLTVVTLLFFGDEILERSLETKASQLLGVPVEIDNLTLYLRGPAFSFDGLRVVNPENPRENLLELGQVTFFLAGPPLWKRKVLIQHIEINEIAFGTRRKHPARTTGLPPDRFWTPELSAQMQRFADRLDRALQPPRPFNLDSLVQTTPLRSITRLRQIRHRAELAFPPATLSPDETTSASNGHGRVPGAKARAMWQEVQAGLAQVDSLVEVDYADLLRATGYDSIRGTDLAVALYLPGIVEAVGRVAPWVHALRRHMPTTAELEHPRKVERPPRGVGQTIAFPVDDEQPAFFVRRITIQPPRRKKQTSRFDVLGFRKIKGEVSGLTSHAATYGYPMFFEIDVVMQQPRSYNVSGTVDHTTEFPNESVQFLAAGREILDVPFLARPYLPQSMRVLQGNFGATFAFSGESLEFTFGLSAPAFEFEWPTAEPADSLARAVRRTLERLPTFVALLKGYGPPENLTFLFDSNLAERLARTLESQRDPTVESLRQALRQALTRHVAAQKEETVQFIRARVESGE